MPSLAICYLVKLSWLLLLWICLFECAENAHAHQVRPGLMEANVVGEPCDDAAATGRHALARTLNGKGIQSNPSLAICYLVRQAALVQLNLSLVDLYHNVIPSNPNADVLLFSPSDSGITETDMNSIILYEGKERKRLRFVHVPDMHWNVPTWLWDPTDLWMYIHDDKKHVIGYRLMCRFFTLGLFEIVDSMGYDYVLRLDTDSHILSPIQYDMAALMHDRKYTYAWRMGQHEGHKWLLGFAETIRMYVAMYNVPVDYFLDFYQIQTISDLTLEVMATSITFYNNFFLTRVSFWREKKVLHFLNFLDRVGGIFTHRWGDAVTQTTAVALFLDRYKDVPEFTRFAYQHRTRVGKDKHDRGVGWWTKIEGPYGRQERG